MPFADRIEAAWRSAQNAAELIAGEAASVDVWWLALGVALHFLAMAVRQPAWLAILRAAYPEARELRLRDVQAAYFAGSGLNTVLPARGGDVVKLFLLHRRIRDSRYSTLGATFVPETLFETACGIALVAWAWSQGFLPVPASTTELPSLDVSFVIDRPLTSLAAVAGATLLGVAAWRRFGDRARRFVARVRQGLRILRRPRDYLVHVASWQALGRLVRLASIACLMVAFGLPVTLAAVILVMAAQGGTRIIPIAPASTGLRIALLSYGLVEVTGQPVDVAAVSAFAFGTGAVQLVVGLLIAIGVLLGTVGHASPRRALRAARAAMPELAPDRTVPRPAPRPARAR